MCEVTSARGGNSMPPPVTTVTTAHLRGVSILEVDALEDKQAPLATHAKESREPLGVDSGTSANATQNELRASVDAQFSASEQVLRPVAKKVLEHAASVRGQRVADRFEGLQRERRRRGRRRRQRGWGWRWRRGASRAVCCSRPKMSTGSAIPAQALAYSVTDLAVDVGSLVPRAGRIPRVDIVGATGVAVAGGHALARWRRRGP